ncbi:MAG: ABC transporter ATP-binding protein/permease [Eubacterium sp.]|nr:ABC transporter ATP-binding protein/permease [Eubacterium sp.]MCM1213123.1 ABC transporter ATP-binding protein/permease [Lachnospiraceae bacterium]MCM1239428.1 ABC transporter ATP-binding protein/permease [Lachnospiraceae bacterium]
MNNNMIAILWKLVKKSRKTVAVTLFVILVSVVMTLIPPLILEEIVNRLTEKEALVLSVAFAYLGMLAVSNLLESLQNVMLTVMGQKLTHSVRSEMCGKLSRMQAGYFTKVESGKITSRFVNDVDAVDTLFSNGIVGMFANACKVVGILAVIFYKSLGLGILLLCIMPCLFVMTRYIQKRMLKAQMANRAAIGKVNNHVPETIRNMRSIRTLSIQKYMEAKYDIYIEESYRALEKTNFYNAIYSPIVVSLSSCVIAVMMVCSSMGSAMQQFFGITVGSAVAIIAYVGKVFNPIESIGMEIQNIQTAIAGIRRIDEFLEEEEAPWYEEEETRGTDVRFESVSFAYDPAHPVLENLNLTVKEGENVTLAGRTGAGKSTVFRLLLGLYEPQEGSVTIGGVAAGHISGEKRRYFLGYVEQQFHPCMGTVEDQITLYDPAFDRKTVEETAQMVGLHEKILALPQGYDTPMEHADFSQGELQLLSIARAVVARPKIMLLDEITANLDSVTEARVLEVLKKASEGRTVISISHRIHEKMQQGRLIMIG